MPTVTPRFGSLFSGIGGFDLGFERAGMECAWQCEIDKNCQTLLQRKFGAKLYDDVRTITATNTEPVDVICGGFPCQDVSIAGKRAGFAGERSGLWTEFARIISELKPGWVVIENVPGLLSSNQGRDFQTVLDQMVESGYGVCWRILDAQYFGVAQRRRRVFIVGSLGNGRSAEVLFESEGVRWNPPTRGKEGQGIAGEVASMYQKTSHQEVMNGVYRMTAFGEYADDDKAGALKQRDWKDATDIVAFETGQGYWQEGETTGTLRSEGENRPSRPSNIVAGVRRLTPTECERLQGFPDGWTEYTSSSVQNCGNMNETNLRRFQSCVTNAQFQDAIENLLIEKTASASCTIKDLKNMELSIFPIEKNPNLKSAKSVTDWLEIVEREDFVQDTISRGNVMATLSNRSEILTQGEEIARALLGNTGRLWKISSVENYSRENLSTILTWIKQITTLTTCTCVKDMPNTCEFIVLWNEPLPNFCEEKLYSLRMEYTKLQSDSTRYKQLGNAVAVPVAEWIGERITHAYNNPA